MITAEQSARSDLAAIVGEDGVSTDEAARQKHAIGSKLPQYVVYPQTAEQVADLLQHAAAHGLTVVPSRNGTKLAVGNPPRRYEIALSLKDMNRVWHYEPDDLTLSVEPGMKLADLLMFLARRDLWLPLDPLGGDRASIGGILATNSNGPLRLRYGTPRDMVLGMKIATTGGQVIKTGGRVVKNVTGYDISKLLIGSHGTLGVIVEASFKLFTLPARRATCAISVPALDAARDFRRRLLDSPLRPMRMMLLNKTALQRVAGNPSLEETGSQFEIFLQAGGTPPVLQRFWNEIQQLASSSGCRLRGSESDFWEEAAAPFARAEQTGILSSLTAAELWKRISDPREGPGSNGQHWMLAKAALAISAGEQFAALAIAEARQLGIDLAIFAQIGSGIVHLGWDEAGNTLRVSVDLVEGMHREATRLGGVLVVEARPPALMDGLDAWGPPGDDFEIMRKLKNAWDPGGVMAPGRFVGGI